MAHQRSVCVYVCVREMTAGSPVAARNWSIEVEAMRVINDAPPGAPTWDTFTNTGTASYMLPSIQYAGSDVGGKEAGWDTEVLLIEEIHLHKDGVRVI